MAALGKKSEVTDSTFDVFNEESQQEKVEKTRWFSRRNKGILTSTADKKDTPEGFWNKCPNCNFISTSEDLKENHHICSKCQYHHRIGSTEYFEILFDQPPTYLFDNIQSIDKLEFVDLKPYHKRLEDIQQNQPELKDAIRVATGLLNNQKIVIGCMDFQFIGGSLGSVMGEKICRAATYSIEHKIPLLIICKSGGARMMESAFSLMQLAKTSGKLFLLSEAKIPFFTLLTDPTFGGVSASFGMLGDLILAEPGALIGFAGPRVIKETIKRDLPEGFQKSEFLLEHGFIDSIVSRNELKSTLNKLLKLFSH